MRDYWLVQYVLSGVGWAYVLVSATALFLAFKSPSSKTHKLVTGGVVLALVSILPIRGASVYLDERKRSEEHAIRYAKAKALFEKRCKTASERIVRKVENVEGLILANLRPEKVSESSQFDTDDQYGHNVGGDDYIRYYLIGSSDGVSRYGYVETTRDGKILRYETSLRGVESRSFWIRGGGRIPIQQRTADHFNARYVVEWKDISTREDRESWIAGGALQITDRLTGELIAERIGYVFDTGLGSTDGQRAPWAWARYYTNSCPSVQEHNRVFVEKVLKPSREGLNKSTNHASAR